MSYVEDVYKRQGPAHLLCTKDNAHGQLIGNLYQPLHRFKIQCAIIQYLPVIFHVGAVGGNETVEHIRKAQTNKAHTAAGTDNELMAPLMQRCV